MLTGVIQISLFLQWLRDSLVQMIFLFDSEWLKAVIFSCVLFYVSSFMLFL